MLILCLKGALWGFLVKRLMFSLIISPITHCNNNRMSSLNMKHKDILEFLFNPALLLTFASSQSSSSKPLWVLCISFLWYQLILLMCAHVQPCTIKYVQKSPQNTVSESKIPHKYLHFCFSLTIHSVYVLSFSRVIEINNVTFRDLKKKRVCYQAS